MLNKVASKILNRVAQWALSKNPPGGYDGEDDERWAYTIVGKDGSPYLTRILLTRLPLLDQIRKRLKVGVYLHHFHRSDGDQHMHDHPWAWGASLVLSGAYVEERLDQLVERPDFVARSVLGLKSVKVALTDTKLVRWFNYLTKDDFHAVRELRGDVWTLFVTGERVQDWGFLVDGRKVPWREYLSGLDAATGEELDRIGFIRWKKSSGEIHDCEPRRVGEPDYEYRERIRAAMRAESAKESK